MAAEVESSQEHIMEEFGDIYNYIDDFLKEMEKEEEEEQDQDDEVDLSLKFCYQSIIQGGHAMLIISYLIASFIYFITFNKSLRWYLLLKCLVVAISSASSIVANVILLVGYKEQYFTSGFYKYHTMFQKVVVASRFLVCNFNFLFQYEIYCLVCQSAPFSENLMVKLLVASLLAFLPAASTFRYAKMDVGKLTEEFFLELGYNILLFFFMVFFIHKIRKALMKSIKIRASSTASSPEDRRRLQKIFYFLIVMAIFHLLYMTPRILLSVMSAVVTVIQNKCDQFTDNCLSTISRLSCDSYFKDILHISVAFLDIFPFFVFMKFDKFKLC